MISIDELENIIILNRLNKNRLFSDLFRRGMSPSQVLEHYRQENAEYLDAVMRGIDPKKEIDLAERLDVKLIHWFSENYPQQLRQISDPPILLYVAGHIENIDQAAVAMVGTRHPSFYGKEHARSFSRVFAENGLTIVSGFAKGIDYESHEGALSCPYGRTIAVLGCGIDVKYPKGHEKLFDKIRARGAVISEYPFGTSPRAENFPRRNRIISGMSLGVLVVEAHSRSGSLITAHEAIDQGREVFAIPGPINQLTSRGTHRLIKEGATLVENPEEVIQNLSLMLLNQKNNLVRENQAPMDFPKMPAPSQMSIPFDFEENRSQDSFKPILEQIAKQPLTYEELVSCSGFDYAQVLSRLTELELLGKVRKNLDGRFICMN